MSIGLTPDQPALPSLARQASPAKKATTGRDFLLCPLIRKVVHASHIRSKTRAGNRTATPVARLRSLCGLSVELLVLHARYANSISRGIYSVQTNKQRKEEKNPCVVTPNTQRLCNVIIGSSAAMRRFNISCPPSSSGAASIF